MRPKDFYGVEASSEKLKKFTDEIISSKEDKIHLIELIEEYAHNLSEQSIQDFISYY